MFPKHKAHIDWTIYMPIILFVICAILNMEIENIQLAIDVRLMNIINSLATAVYII